jgi:hypothetical protein
VFLVRSLTARLARAVNRRRGKEQFGIVWYFTNVLAHDPNLLRFPTPPTPPR